ncbi:MAG: DNA-formamidopyrimidine glycosylase, partial [Gammaproteobacteria bacterium CG22_combo_CG10-13_8_21_14_all_40_8]
MPELPEVETTRRGLEPYLTQQTVTHLVVRNGKLRWPVDPELHKHLCGQSILEVTRRAKYLILKFSHGSLMIHLGMSGSLRILSLDGKDEHPVQKHDHIDIQLSNDKILRYRDPRRFGAMIWTELPLEQHKLIAHLGPEPLSQDFTGIAFYKSCMKRNRSIKQQIMDSSIVVGVGNIYANEALFLAGMHPATPSQQITKKQAALLVTIIQQVLTAAIEQGGTTLKDFYNIEGKPGYFVQQLRVYGRKNEPCVHCSSPIQLLKQGQRSSFYCP